MNPKCPECQTELNEDFGIVTCSSCGAVCSVDLDGNAEMQEKVQNADDIHEDADQEDSNHEDSDETSDEFVAEDEGEEFQEKTAVDTELGSLDDDFSSDIEDALGEDLSESLSGESDDLSDSLSETDEIGSDSDVSDGDDDEHAEQENEWGAPLESEEDETLDELKADSDLDTEPFEEESGGDFDGEDSDEDQDSDATEDELLTSEDEDGEEVSEDGAFEETESVEDAPRVQTPLSGSGFFKNLELFTEQLEPQDHHHTYYRLKVSGFETESDLEDVLDLTLDDRLGLIKDSLEFDETKQSFIIPKISFLRLVTLHKRLSTIHFISMEWTLAEDQTDILDPEIPYEDEDATEVGEPITPSPGDDDETLYEEDVDESDV